MKKFILLHSLFSCFLTLNAQKQKFHAFSISTDPFLFNKVIPNLELGWMVNETIGLVVNGEYSSNDKYFENFSQNAYSNQFYAAIQYKPYSASFFNKIGNRNFEIIKPWSERRKMLGKLCIAPMLEVGYVYSKYDYKFVAREGININLDQYSVIISNSGVCMTPSLDIKFAWVFFDIGYQYKVLFPKIEGNNSIIGPDFYTGTRPSPFRVEAMPSFKIGIRLKF